MLQECFYQPGAQEISILLCFYNHNHVRNSILNFSVTILSETHYDISQQRSVGIGNREDVDSIIAGWSDYCR